MILVKDVRRAGFSTDGTCVALADEKGISVIMHPDYELNGIEVVYYDWHSIQSTIAGMTISPDERWILWNDREPLRW